MKRNPSLWLSIAALAVAGAISVPETAEAQPETATMYAMGRGDVQIIRLYDKPDPLGKTMKSLPTGSTIEVFTDQLYNKYWYKTADGFYAHEFYLSETDPMADIAAAGDPEVSAQAQREDALMQKYKDITVVNDILIGNVKPNMTMDMVEDAWGAPDDKRLLESGVQGDIWLWTYDNETRKVDIKFDHRKRVAEIRNRP